MEQVHGPFLGAAERYSTKCRQPLNEADLFAGRAQNSRRSSENHCSSELKDPAEVIQASD